MSQSDPTAIQARYDMTLPVDTRIALAQQRGDTAAEDLFRGEKLISPAVTDAAVVTDEELTARGATGAALAVGKKKARRSGFSTALVVGIAGVALLGASEGAVTTYNYVQSQQLEGQQIRIALDGHQIDITFLQKSKSPTGLTTQGTSGTSIDVTSNLIRHREEQFNIPSAEEAANRRGLFFNIPVDDLRKIDIKMLLVDAHGNQTTDYNQATSVQLNGVAVTYELVTLPDGIQTIRYEYGVLVQKQDRQWMRIIVAVDPFGKLTFGTMDRGKLPVTEIISESAKALDNTGYTGAIFYDTPRGYNKIFSDRMNEGFTNNLPIQAFIDTPNAYSYIKQNTQAKADADLDHTLANGHLTHASLTSVGEETFALIDIPNLESDSKDEVALAKWVLNPDTHKLPPGLTSSSAQPQNTGTLVADTTNVEYDASKEFLGPISPDGINIISA